MWQSIAVGAVIIAAMVVGVMITWRSAAGEDGCGSCSGECGSCEKLGERKRGKR